MTLAQRVRDIRYAKGWGPDELASRADISRTALYQIESGKTELPRAKTLRQIAMALDVSIDVLLDQEALFALKALLPTLSPLPIREATRPVPRSSVVPSPINQSVLANGGLSKGRSVTEMPDHMSRVKRAASTRQNELERKFLEVLESPLGEGLARIVEEAHRLLQSADALS